MRHPTWNTLNDLIDQIIERYGGSIYDHRVHKSWDPGQAVCAELYGPGWNDDPGFVRDNQQPDSEPVPVGGIEAAERLAAGECQWAETAGST